MKIHVKVKTGAKIQRVEKISEGKYEVDVKSPGVAGKANAEMLKLLKQAFSGKQVKISSGPRNPNKIVEIVED